MINLLNKEANTVYLHYGYLMLNKHLSLQSRQEQLLLINSLWILALSKNLHEPEDDIIVIMQVKQNLSAILTKVKQAKTDNQNDNFFIEQLLMFWTNQSNLVSFNNFVNNLSAYLDVKMTKTAETFKDKAINKEDKSKNKESSISEL